MERKRVRNGSPLLAKYTVVVTCVLIKKLADNREMVLILKRSAQEQEGPGLWTIPGGKIQVRDWGKRLPYRVISHSIWQGMLSRAIIREIKEETGLRVRRVSFLQGREKVFLRKDKTPTLILVFRAFVGPKTRARTGKSTGLCWVTESELKRYEFIGNVKSDIMAAFRRNGPHGRRGRNQKK